LYISEDTITQIKDHVNIVNVIGEFVPLKKSGQNYKGLCPFHTEKTPSFVVNPQKGIFHCFGCGVGGNVFNFLMKLKGISFPDAVRLLGERAGIHVETEGRRDVKRSKVDILYKINETASSFFANNLLSEKGVHALRYLKIRKIDSTTTKAFHLGYSLRSWDALLLYLQSKGFGTGILEESGLILKKRRGDGYYDRFRNRIIFPIQDSIGRYVGFGARILETENEEGPKYINTNENLLFHKGKQLYGFYNAEEFIRREDSVFVVEGYFDVIRMYKEGFRNAVAPLGTALTEEQIALILRYTRNIYLLFDPDEAGLKAALRSINMLFKRGVEPYIVRFPQGKDPGDFFDEYSGEEFDILREDAVPGIDFIIGTFIDEKKVYTANEKIIILHRLSDYYTGMESTILKDELIAKTSKVLKTEEYILKKEIEKFAKKNVPQIRRGSSGEKEHIVVSAELRLLLFLLSNPEYFHLVEARLDESYFNGKWTKRLWNAILKAQKVSDWNSGTVLDYLDDEKYIEYISGKLMDEVLTNNPKETITELMVKLKKNKLENQITAINKKLAKAELENDEASKSTLLLELAAQENELKKWKSLKSLDFSQ
jgi:DNA primase